VEEDADVVVEGEDVEEDAEVVEEDAEVVEKEVEVVEKEVEVVEKEVEVVTYVVFEYVKLVEVRGNNGAIVLVRLELEKHGIQ